MSAGRLLIVDDESTRSILGEYFTIGPHVVFVDDPHPINCEKYQ